MQILKRSERVMWGIEYSDEAKYCFINNDPYTFDLLVKIEELRYSIDGIPPSVAHWLSLGFISGRCSIISSIIGAALANW